MIVKTIHKGPVKLCWQMHVRDRVLSRQNVLPSSSFHLVYLLKGRIEIEGIEKAVDIPFIAPLLASHKQIGIQPGTEIFGLHLDPAFGSAIFSSGMEEVRRNAHDVSNIFPAKARAKLKDAVLKPATFDERVRAVINFFEGFFPEKEYEKRRTIQAIHHFLQAKKNIRFQEISNELGYSMRWMQISHKEVCGVTPCEMLRIVRFNKFINNIYRQGKADTHVALDCGYYDQAHAIREFQRLAGTTPGKFASSLPPINKVLNYQPVTVH